MNLSDRRRKISKEEQLIRISNCRQGLCSCGRKLIVSDYGGICPSKQGGCGTFWHACYCKLLVRDS